MQKYEKKKTLVIADKFDGSQQMLERFHVSKITNDDSKNAEPIYELDTSRGRLQVYISDWITTENGIDFNIYSDKEFKEEFFKK